MIIKQNLWFAISYEVNNDNNNNIFQDTDLLLLENRARSHEPKSKRASQVCYKISDKSNDVSFSE